MVFSIKSILAKIKTISRQISSNVDMDSAHNLADLEIRNQGTYYGTSRNGLRLELFRFP